jgi:AbrB family looped-hinge helix DNA binding protein
MRITSKGQVTIPKHIRDATGLHPESDARFELIEGGALIRPAPARSTDERIEEWLGSAPRPTLTGDQLIALTRGEE